jgi:flagellar biosynthesis GTPase FlhF
MRTRTYKGESVHAVMRQVRTELGDNVVLLNTTEHGAQDVEIEIAVLDESAAPSDFESTPEPSLSTLADLYRDNDASTALAMNGLSADIRAFCAPYLRKVSQDSEGLAKVLSKIVTFDGSLPFASRAVALVGPTGVGKTTTIAKLSARLQVALGIRVGLVAADAYRVGAEFHLGAFAQLLGVPIASLDASLPVHNQIPEAISRLEECDLIFIDTPGVAVRDRERFEYLEQLLSSCKEMEKLLTLPAPSNEFDLGVCVKAYSRLGCTRTIVTKIDESGYLGPLLNVVHQTDLPLAFFTMGQRVPEDVEPASARRLAWMLMRRMH